MIFTISGEDWSMTEHYSLMAKLAFSDNNNKNCRHLADTYTQVTCTVFLGLHSITSYDITSAVKGIDNI